jgi:hypothetical protein
VSDDATNGNDGNNDHPTGPHFHGIAIPVPDGVFPDPRRARMAADEREASVNDLLDSLNVQQLVALRRLLNMDQESAMNNYVDGQVVTLLRRIHNVDPHTGMTEQEAIEAAALRRG